MDLIEWLINFLNKNPNTDLNAIRNAYNSLPDVQWNFNVFISTSEVKNVLSRYNVG